MPPHHVAVGSNGCLPTPCAWPRHRRASRLYSVALMLVVALAACHCTVSVHGSRVLEHASQPSARHLAMTSGPYWYRAGNGSFTGRDCSASLFFNNRMWVFGGGPHGGVPYDDVWYSQDGEIWTLAEEHAPWSARSFHSVTIVEGFSTSQHQPSARGGSPSMAAHLVSRSSGGGGGDTSGNVAPKMRRNQASAASHELLLIGGVDASGAYLNDVWFSSDGVNWVQRSSKAAWPQRAGHSSVFLNGRIFVLGGFGGTHALNDVWYSADGINWFVATKAAAWTARGAARAVVYDNAIYLMGGQALTSAGDAAALPFARKRAAQNVVLFNDVWRSGNGESWVRVSSGAAWSKRSMFGLVVYLGELFLFGGRPYTNDVWRSHNGELWTPVTDHALWSARAGLGAAYLANNAVPGGVFVVLGGDSETSDGLSDVWLARPDVLCEINGLVCSMHGVCAADGICECNFGWTSQLCDIPVCNASLCKHGTCVPYGGSEASMLSSSSSSSSGSGGVGEICQCDDEWMGPMCTHAKCLPGCSSIHGTCENAPGTCTCEPRWTGPLCTLPYNGDTAVLRRLGHWTTEHVTLLYAGVGASMCVLILSTTLYMNYWSRRRAVHQSRVRRVRFASAAKAN